MERATRDAGLPGPARFVASTGSTNSDLLAMAERAPDWSVLVAAHQTAGRGRLGRSWSSPPGASLSISVLIRPGVAPAAAPLISLAAGAAMAGACRASGVQAACKWPNDVVVGERKLAGVLPEASVEGGELRHVVVGAGVNVSLRADDVPEELRGHATSLAIEGGSTDPEALLTSYLRGLMAGASEDPAATLHRYRELCSTIGRRVRASTTRGEVVEGVAVDVSGRGGLVLDTTSGPREVSFGEVEHLR